MNAIAKNALVLNVIANDKNVVENILMAYRKEKGTKVTSLKELFEIGIGQADFQIDMADFAKHKIGNGTGYYDPLIHATFKDGEGKVAPAGSLIWAYDVETERRLAIFVVYEGENLIVHERYRNVPGSQFMLVTTGSHRYNTIIGMEPCWVENSMYDLVGCCNLFGFEFNRREDNVFVPINKMSNLINNINMVVAEPQLERLQRQSQRALVAIAEQE